MHAYVFAFVCAFMHGYPGLFPGSYQWCVVSGLNHWQQKLKDYKERWQTLTRLACLAILLEFVVWGCVCNLFNLKNPRFVYCTICSVCGLCIPCTFTLVIRLSSEISLSLS